VPLDGRKHSPSLLNPTVNLGEALKSDYTLFTVVASLQVPCVPPRMPRGSSDAGSPVGAERRP